MELTLQIAEGKDVTNNDISKIVVALIKAGYEVEVLPLQIKPQVIKIRRGK